MRVMKFVKEKIGAVICRLCGQTNVIQPVVYPSRRAVYPQDRSVAPTKRAREDVGSDVRDAERQWWTT
jgi:hypothetical protein